MMTAERDYGVRVVRADRQRRVLVPREIRQQIVRADVLEDVAVDRVPRVEYRTK